MEWQNWEWKLCHKYALPTGHHCPLQELQSELLSWQGEVHSLNFSLGSPGTFGYLWWEVIYCYILPCKKTFVLVAAWFQMFLLNFTFLCLSLNLFLNESRMVGFQDECIKALILQKLFFTNSSFVFKASVLSFLRRVLCAFAQWSGRYYFEILV